MLNQRRVKRDFGKLVKRVSELETEVKKLKSQINQKTNKTKNKG